MKKMIEMDKLNFFFILGNHPKLSLAELRSVLNQKPIAVEVYPLKRWINFALFNLEKDDRVQNLINILGGTIKIGLIINHISPDTIVGDICDLIKQLINIKKDSPKVYFGISCYNIKIDLKKIALTVKKRLQEGGISSHWVESKDRVLSSVIVKTNKLLTPRGIELVVLRNKNDILLGVTKSVQPFAEFSERDYGRPYRDARSGLLPPKLARIMINLANDGQNINKESLTFLDPFCGSGTILQEALILGYKNIIGADVSKQAIEDTRRNLKWLSQRGGFERLESLKLILTDARGLITKISSQSIELIVTEPYLGPPLRGNESISQIKKILAYLQKLYLDSFKEFKKILKPKSRVVIIFPIIHNQRLQILNEIRRLGFLTDERFKDLYDDQERQSFLYSRLGQKVRREILIFVKN